MNTGSAIKPTTQILEIELLALNLKTCTRCVGSLANIQQAVALLEEVLSLTGVIISVSPVLIESEEQARQHQFIASPTIRINGLDIAPEIIESQCEHCSTDLCGCIGGVTCRVWRYRCEDYTEAPVGAIIDAILSAIYSHPSEVFTSPLVYTDVPDNLKQFFNSKLEPTSACCSDTKHSICCKVEEKADCCGVETSTPTICDCQ